MTTLNNPIVFPVRNQQVAGSKGPLALILGMDFSLDTSFDINLQNVQALKQFDLCQAIYVDNSGNAPVFVTIGNPGSPIMKVTARPNTQGWYQVICPNPIVMQFTSSSGAAVNVTLVNVAMPGVVWDTI